MAMLIDTKAGAAVQATSAVAEDLAAADTRVRDHRNRGNLRTERVTTR
jgi:hypothetical protein